MTADDVRTRAIEAGADAVHRCRMSGESSVTVAAAVLDAVEPIIRADERRIAVDALCDQAQDAVDAVLADLRAKVEAERDKWLATRVSTRAERVHGLNWVLALFDEVQP